MSYENIQDAKSTPPSSASTGWDICWSRFLTTACREVLTEIFYQLQLAGLTPILTHPERNPTLQNDETRVTEWLQRGVLVQVTAGSVLGRMGKHAERMAHELLENRWVHFLATDAHNTTSRVPKMREAFELVANKYGSDYAHLLCVSNPLAVFLGKPMPPQLEPAESLQRVRRRRVGGSRVTGAC